MEGTDILWAEWRDEIEKAKFSIIAGQLLVEELDKIAVDDWKTLKDFKRRHKKHIRAANKHRRRACRIMTRIERRDKKAGKHG